jgi:hypothetical protein
MKNAGRAILGGIVQSVKPNCSLAVVPFESFSGGVIPKPGAIQPGESLP